METNNFYNLITQLAQESKSLWRINKHYIKEAKTKELKIFWENLAKEKEVQIKNLKKFIQKTR